MGVKQLIWFVGAVAVLVACGITATSQAFLFWAVHRDHERLAKISLKLGANPNARSGSHTILMEAAYGAQTPVAEALLARGATIDAVDDEHWQALHYAAKNTQKDGGVVRVLLEHGANPVAPANGGVTPLMLAASALSGGTTMNAVAMIAYANDVNQQDEDGYTALFIAATEASVQSMRALLRAGANPNLANKHGHLPITFAAENGLVDRVQPLLTFGADPILKPKGQPSAIEIVHGAAGNVNQKAAFDRIAGIFDAYQISRASGNSEQRKPSGR
jgi:ankyrin repeat protein